MPSPLKGLTMPPASPTSRSPSAYSGVRLKPMGRAAPRIGPAGVVLEVPVGGCRDPAPHDVLEVGLGKAEGCPGCRARRWCGRPRGGRASRSRASGCACPLRRGSTARGALHVVVAARGGVVGPHGHSHHAVVALGAADRRGEAGRDPVAGDDDRGAVGNVPAVAARLVERLAVTPATRPDPSRSGPVTLVRSCSRAPLLRRGGRGSRRSHPGADQAVGRKRGLRPVELQRVPAALDPQPLGALTSRVGCRTPSEISSLVARGVRPSPQILSRGKAAFSSSRTSSPAAR